MFQKHIWTQYFPYQPKKNIQTTLLFCLTAYSDEQFIVIIVFFLQFF